MVFTMFYSLQTDVGIQLDFYDEHLAEIGAILLSLSEDARDYDEYSWVDVRSEESRLLIHVDAIEVGGSQAIKYCRSLISSIEEDELLGVLYSLVVIASLSNDLLNDVVSSFQVADEESVKYYKYAFQYASNPLVSNSLLSFLKHESSVVRAIAAEALGYRGDADPHRIWPLFHDEDETVKVAAMVAVMRLGFKNAVPAMEQAVLDRKEMFNEHCVFPLLMLGSQKALKFIRLACQSESHIKPQYLIYLALGGDEDDLPIILNALEYQDMNSAVLEALGIFGSLKGVNTLIKFLSSENDEEKLAAAKSLNRISGAELYEKLSVVEKEDEDISAADITGKVSKSEETNETGDGRLVEIKQDCTDKQRWTAWWKVNAGSFNTTLRYRNGKPFSFLLCLEEIAHPQAKYEDRQRAYNELVIRSGHHIPFEPDWFVDKQVEALKKWQVWWNSNKSGLTNQWMFDGV